MGLYKRVKWEMLHYFVDSFACALSRGQRFIKHQWSFGAFSLNYSKRQLLTKLIIVTIISALLLFVKLN